MEWQEAAHSGHGSTRDEPTRVFSAYGSRGAPRDPRNGSCRLWRQAVARSVSHRPDSLHSQISVVIRRVFSREKRAQLHILRTLQASTVLKRIVPFFATGQNSYSVQ